MSKKTDSTTPVQEAMTPEAIIAQAQAEAEAIRAAALASASDIRRQAEEEADGIRKEARDTASGGDAAPEQATKPVPKHDEGEEYVEVELFRDNGRYKDDVLVCVNGESCQIQRGVRTKIKRKFYWAIQNQMRQDKATSIMLAKMHDDFDAAARANNVNV